MRWRYPTVWVGAFENFNVQGAPLLRVSHFVSILVPVVFSWRHRNGQSLKENETRRSEQVISNWTHYSEHCLRVVGTRNGNQLMMSLWIECAKFGKKHRRNLSEYVLPPFSLFQSLCHMIYYKRDLISRKFLWSLLYQKVVYWKIRQYGLSKFEFTDNSDLPWRGSWKSFCRISLLWGKLY